ncbi:hypothetical protein [Rhodanobacter denitrificans]|uniref:Uncharacterized protein n=1 Tax=Rhodanobacter denitrificans TaxID=666685 RepID=M4NN70_9GAMM|nr:hypothetical protein [Rhodanobacter denitrificans]AGG89151.1 hypothetical protein R2APBS1_2028 [Rhodanobacter denitrificans]UJJ52973.1 hypothetical protein LRK52_18905 [Rhodanobacter denitrificans]
MAHPSGTHVVGPCPYCGQRYTLTNYMRRFHDPASDGAGRFLTDTHLIACFRKRTVAPTRRLRDGGTVPELTDPVTLSLTTRAPGKWLAVDRETGEVWRGAPDGWQRAEAGDTAALLSVGATPASDVLAAAAAWRDAEQAASPVPSDKRAAEARLRAAIDSWSALHD